MDVERNVAVSGSADDPAVVAQALNLLGAASNVHACNFEALAALLGVIVGQGAPKGSELHARALAAIDAVRSIFPGAGVTGVFEACMRGTAASPPTDGGGLPLNDAPPFGPAGLLRKAG